MSSEAAQQLLARTDFRKLWCIGLITGSLRWLEVLVIGIYTFEITGSAFTVALMLFARTLPGVVLGAATGALASRYRRKHILSLGMALAMINSLIMLLLATTGLLSLWAIACGAIINGSVWTLEHPVRRTLLGDVAGTDLLRQAMSLDQFTVNGTRLLGPLAGGAVYTALGLSGTYLFSSLGFACAALLAVLLSTNPPTVAKKGEGFITLLIQGIRYIRTKRVLRGILIFTIIANFFGFSYVTMIPVIGRELLQLAPFDIGVLQSMEGVGAVVAAMLLTTTSRNLPYARSCVIGGLTFLSLLVVFALSRSFTISCAALLIAGLGVGCFGAMQSTTLLHESEPQHRMRVMGVLVMCIGAAPAGVLTTGALADRFGPSTALLTMAISGLIAAALCLQRYPELLRR
jgi:predicted MFS family arabinose efflux permease